MERTKIRPSDNIRTFYLSRFFMEYLLRSRRQETEAAAKRKEKGIIEEEPLKRLLPLGLVGEMAEMDSVRWVVMRMKFSMDERVRRLSGVIADDSHLHGTSFKPVSIALPKSYVFFSTVS